MTEERLNEILEIKRLLNDANWLLSELEKTSPVTSLCFYGKGDTTSCYDDATINNIIEVIKYGKESLEKIFNCL